jgi:hypothetical protein
MVEVQVTPDCGDAPRKLILRDFSVAIAERATATVLAAVSDDIEWEIIGRRVCHGKAELRATLESMAESAVTMLRLDNLITHGNEAAVGSRVHFGDGRQLRCCDVYTFTSAGRAAKIARIHSFWIQV